MDCSSTCSVCELQTQHQQMTACRTAKEWAGLGRNRVSKPSAMTSMQDMDFFGELTPEEQKAADEKKRIIEEAKARGAAKAKLTKSMIIMDVKPWDDTTGAPAARRVQLFGACHTECRLSDATLIHH